jgi:hypothetical protein
MILIGLPVDVDGGDEEHSGSVLIIHASEAGLRLRPFNPIHSRRRINFKASFPRGNAFETFRVEAEIGWKDVYFWENWRGYQYALKWVESLDGHYLKLKRLFSRFPGTAKISSQGSHRGDSA